MLFSQVFLGDIEGALTQNGEFNGVSIKEVNSFVIRMKLLRTR